MHAPCTSVVQGLSKFSCFRKPSCTVIVCTSKIFFPLPIWDARFENFTSALCFDDWCVFLIVCPRHSVELESVHRVLLRNFLGWVLLLGCTSASVSRTELDAPTHIYGVLEHAVTPLRY